MFSCPSKLLSNTHTSMRAHTHMHAHTSKNPNINWNEWDLFAFTRIRNHRRKILSFRSCFGKCLQIGLMCDCVWGWLVQWNFVQIRCRGLLNAKLKEIWRTEQIPSEKCCEMHWTTNWSVVDDFGEVNFEKQSGKIPNVKQIQQTARDNEKNYE